MSKSSQLFIAAILLFITSCSQSRTGIYRAYSFYKTNSPGNIAVDDNGKPIGRAHDTTRIIYFESKKGVKPQVKAVIVNGNYYKPVLSEITGNTEEAGSLLETNKPVIIKARSNTQLWKVGPGNKIEPLSNSKLKNDLIYLVVEYREKRSKRTIESSKELVPDLNY